MDTVTIESLVAKATKENTTISAVVIREQSEDLEISPADLITQMEGQLSAMIESVSQGRKKDLRSTSGLTGGSAYKLFQRGEGDTIGGSIFVNMLARATAVSELNAAMGRIVACPTAGSCGIVPGALITLMEEKMIPREQVVLSLFTAAAVGLVIAQKATIAGAEGGCQAECGTSSAMAAAAMIELSGGTPEMVGHGVAIAIKNVLGLVCDPVAGLVEIPCIKRNAGGVANALCAAEIALAGVPSFIPPDEAIAAMKEIGDTMPAILRETSEGGLAVTPTGQRLREQVFPSK